MGKHLPKRFRQNCTTYFFQTGARTNTTTLKISGWNLKISQFKRNITWTKPMLIFGGGLQKSSSQHNPTKPNATNNHNQPKQPTHHNQGTIGCTTVYPCYLAGGLKKNILGFFPPINIPPWYFGCLLRDFPCRGPTLTQRNPISTSKVKGKSLASRVTCQFCDPRTPQNPKTFHINNWDPFMNTTHKQIWTKCSHLYHNYTDPMGIDWFLVHDGIRWLHDVWKNPRITGF